MKNITIKHNSGKNDGTTEIDVSQIGRAELVVESRTKRPDLKLATLILTMLDGTKKYLFVNTPDDIQGLRKAHKEISDFACENPLSQIDVV